MIKIAEQDGAFGKSYPPEASPTPGKTTEDTKQLGVLESENKKLTGSVEKLKKDLKEAQEQNAELTKKLKATEDFIKLAHVNRIVEHKLATKMLKDDGKEAEVKRLQEFEVDTLKVLADELLTFKVELSDKGDNPGAGDPTPKPPEEPAPIAPPTPDPTQPTAEQKLATEEKAMRLKLFGHEEPADEHAVKEMEARLTRIRGW